MKTVMYDKDFGKVFITTRSNACNISMRVKKDGLHVTVSPFTDMKHLMRVLADYRTRLLDSFMKISQLSQPIICDGFKIDAPLFRLVVTIGKVNRMTLAKENDGLLLICPEAIDFSSENIQNSLHAVINRLLKMRSQEVLPARVTALASKHGMRFVDVKISSAKSRWGSCSSNASISLSCNLLLLPEHLIDYVILHELAHTREMNHGPRFWCLLDSMTDGMAHALRNEIRLYTPGRFSK